MGKDEKLQPVPDREIVEKIDISAPSGAGESTFIANWIKEFKKMYKKYEIYKTYSNYSRRGIAECSIDVEALDQSLVIFDDKRQRYAGVSGRAKGPYFRSWSAF